MTSLRLSKYHQQHPFSMNVNGENFGVEYWPGDSRSGMFGGNSNWRGPIWLATNFLLIESLQRFHQYYGNALQVECPSGSGAYMNLANVAKEIQRRIIGIFQSVDGRRPTNGDNEKMNCDPNFKDLILFHEVCAKPCRTYPVFNHYLFQFFHGDDGRGLGASHQTGWTGLVAYQIIQSADHRPTPHSKCCKLSRQHCTLILRPTAPKSFASHYFHDIYPNSEASEEHKEFALNRSYSVASVLGDISPNAL